MSKCFILLCLLMGISASIGCSKRSHGPHLPETGEQHTLASVRDKTKTQYQMYCHSCHSVSHTDAPESFDPDSWATRLADGKDRILERAIVGVGNMPAQGMCMECTEQDLKALIDYMISKR